MPKLEFNGEENEEMCRVRESFGGEHKGKRKENKDFSLYRFPPTREEGMELHEIY